jgi:hypothetical protein
MSYTVCPNCGQNALSVATRCPRCGLAFEAQFFSHSAPRPRPRRLSLGLLLAGVVVAMLVANALWQRFGVAPVTSGMEPAPPAPARPQPKPEPPRKPVVAVRESVVTPPPEVRPTPAPQVAVPPASHPLAVRESVAPVAPVARTPVSAPVSLRTGGGRVFYASTWLNVRSDRSSASPVLRILGPGAAVSVDSLSQGWYRVTSDREPPGWVDRRLLDTLPPAAKTTEHE